MRALRRVLIALVILAVLFVIADRVSLVVAEHEMASKVQSTQNLNVKPSVSIKGFPFLTQVLAKNLHQVDLSADDLKVEASGRQIEVKHFSAQLHGAHLHSGFSSATVDTADGQLVVDYAAISEALNDGLTVSYAGGNKVKVHASVKLPSPLGDVNQTFTGKLAIHNSDAIGVDVSKSQLDSLPLLERLPSSATDKLSSAVNRSLKITGLPAGLHLHSLVAKPDGVHVSLTGNHVDLG